MRTLVAFGVDIPWEAITAIGTWVLAAGTVGVVLLQLRLMRRTLSAEVFTRLNDRWDSPVMRGRRRRLAELLETSRLEDIDSHVVQDVMNFFEDVGSMLRQKYLEIAPTWQAFSVVSRHYWAAFAASYITDMREDYTDPTFYTEFEFLVQKMDREERRRRHRGSAEIRISQRAVLDFLRDEAELPND